MASGPNGEAQVGDTLTYQFTVANISGYDITGITLADATLGFFGLAVPDVLANDPPAVVTFAYVLTPADILAGFIVNTATLTATQSVTGASLSAADTVTSVLPRGASINMVKTANVLGTGPVNLAGDPTAQVGDTIEYDFTVSNVGIDSLENMVIDDPTLGLAGIPVPDIAFNSADEVVQINYIITAADIAQGFITNTATVTGDEQGTGNSVSDSDTITTTLPALP